MEYSTTKIILLLVLLKMKSIASAIEMNNKAKLNIAVIGAGPTGLVSAKHSIAQGHNVTVFDQEEELGGLWVYTDKIGKNKYGLNIHTAMYNDLRANGPVQLMEYPGHYYPKDTIPFPHRTDVLKYIQSYADRYDLKKYIKFSHLIVRVLPIEGEQWEIIVKDLLNDRFITQIYDVVFVCNGHFFAPRIPEIDGASEFKGKILHSHDFRATEEFLGENVLIIGAGVSGFDLTVHLVGVANRVILSRKKNVNESDEVHEKYQKLLPSGTILKGIVNRITMDGVQFDDDTHESVTAIIYATGYLFSYPFLSVDSGIFVDDNFVQPLFKQVINIDHPTMAFIGIPQSANNYCLFDMQVRFALKFFSGEKKLPSKDEMRKDQQAQAEALWKKSYAKRKTHSVVFIQRDYFDQLSILAEIENVPKVLDDLAIDYIMDLINKPTEFRKYKFTVLDDESYTKERYED